MNPSFIWGSTNHDVMDIYGKFLFGFHKLVLYNAHSQMAAPIPALLGAQGSVDKRTGTTSRSSWNALLDASGGVIVNRMQSWGNVFLSTSGNWQGPWLTHFYVQPSRLEAGHFDSRINDNLSGERHPCMTITLIRNLARSKKLTTRFTHSMAERSFTNGVNSPHISFG